MSENLSNKECDKKEIGDRKREGDVGTKIIRERGSNVTSCSGVRE